jgi:hypothetical protein
MLIAADSEYDEHMASGLSAFLGRRYPEAERAYLAAIREAEKFGQRASDDRLARSLYELAQTYHLWRKHSSAELLYQRTLAVLNNADFLYKKDSEIRADSLVTLARSTPCKGSTLRQSRSTNAGSWSWNRIFRIGSYGWSAHYSATVSSCEKWDAEARRRC